MKKVLITAGVLGLALCATLMAASSGQGGARPAGIDPEVLAAREAAWRAYFAGDVKTLGDLLPPEFIGISMNEGPFTDFASTLDGARRFREGGGQLVRLTFPETQAQRFGDVVVLYGRFEVVLRARDTEQTMKGRLTEVFVRRGGKWVHPGWHLDVTPVPGS